MIFETEVIGHVGSVDSNTTQSGTFVLKLNVAANHGYRDSKTNEWVDQTAWVRGSMWGKFGEAFEGRIEKGDLVRLRGRLEFDAETGGPRIWTDQNGNARASFELNVADFKMLKRANPRSGDTYEDDEPVQQPQRQPQRQQSNNNRQQGGGQRQQTAPQRGGGQRPAAPAQQRQQAPRRAPQQQQAATYEEIDPDEIPF